MPIETIVATKMLVSNYQQFTTRKRSSWLLFLGITSIIFGLLINVIPDLTRKQKDPPAIESPTVIRETQKPIPPSTENFREQVTVQTEKSDKYSNDNRKEDKQFHDEQNKVFFVADYLIRDQSDTPISGLLDEINHS